ncbi:hypothetical protein [Streptomyces sp. NPDC007206]|uniref:hypothetical protein n=1 Tax=Streptomyces sp. NPDC007206 TaxID=3154317 RepID=UPI00341135F2
MQEAKLSTRLASARLKYLGMADRFAALVPPRLASFANSIAADGKEWAASIENEAPDFRERVNHEWYMPCAHQGLFAARDPQFLIAVSNTEAKRPNTSWWARVALQTEWDLAGTGAELGVTGCGWRHPEFVMLSTDGNLIVQGTQGQAWTDIVCLREAHRIPPFREMGVKLTKDKSIPEETRDAVDRWLKATAPG